jgi:hypothetical protein
VSPGFLILEAGGTGSGIPWKSLEPVCLKGCFIFARRENSDQNQNLPDIHNLLISLFVLVCTDWEFAMVMLLRKKPG